MHSKARSQVAVVTGAAGALGREIVKELLAKGFFVAATDKSRDALDRLKSLIHESEYMKIFTMDVSNSQSVEDTAKQISDNFSQPVSVLVNNAGILKENQILLPGSSDIAKKVIEINLIGAFNCTSVFAKLMLKKKFGRIINIASTAGVMGAGGGSAYAASKGGLIAATKSWAREMGHFGITTNAVAPGVCKTPMLEGSGEVSRFEDLMLPLVPVRRLGTPFDVAEAVVFFATCQNYINGEVLTLDGGLSTGTLDEDPIVSDYI